MSFFCLAKAKICVFSVWGRVREMGSVSRPPIPSSVGIYRPALWDNVICFTSHIFYTFLHKCSFINYLWQKEKHLQINNYFLLVSSFTSPLTVFFIKIPSTCHFLQHVEHCQGNGKIYILAIVMTLSEPQYSKCILGLADI